MDNKPEWLDHYERSYPTSAVGRQIMRPPKPDSYTMFVRLMEVVQEHQDLIENQRLQIQQLSERVKILESE